jgi:hypothetical protein
MEQSSQEHLEDFNQVMKVAFESFHPGAMVIAGQLIGYYIAPGITMLMALDVETPEPQWVHWVLTSKINESHFKGISRDDNHLKAARGIFNHYAQYLIDLDEEGVSNIEHILDEAMEMSNNWKSGGLTSLLTSNS